MKEVDILEIYYKVIPVIESVSVGNPAKDSWFQIFLGAAFAKCLEFNLVLFDDTYNNSAFFTAAGLRGVCEDLIATKYFKEIIDPKDIQDILFAWSSKQMAEGVEKQNVFFSNNRNQQPVIPYSDMFQNNLKTSNATLKTYRSKYGWNGNLPRIIDMADACLMRPLYDYLYSATSKSVHFSPHFFMRMGWGDIKEEPSFRFSTKNSEHRLNQILHALGEKLIASVKSEIQLVDVATFLAAIPADDLIRYIEKIPMAENLINKDDA